MSDTPNNQSYQQMRPENTNNLIGIGTKQEDFEQIKSGDLDYTILGKGAFGYAEKMKSKLNNKIYAIKKLPVKKEGFGKDFVRETTFMLQSNNEYIVKLYGYFQGMESIEKLKNIYKNSKNLYQNESEDKKMYYLVLDYVPNGSLENFIIKHQSQNKAVEQEFIIKVFKQILTGLKYLHENKIMHRDIKLDNILLDENNNIKISDFGISAIHRDESNEDDQNNVLVSNYSKVGRMDFVAPEILNNCKNFDFKVDIFSLGLTMLWLVSKKNPIALVNGKRTIDTNNIDESLYNIYLLTLIKKMILDDPNLRPTAAEALEELNNIEKYIKDPSPLNESVLNFGVPYQNIVNLVQIGTKPEDFESIKSGDNEYTILGKGAFGYAEKMKSKLDNKFYAVKKIPVTKEGITKDFARETCFMLQSNNEYVVKLYGYFQGIEKISKLQSIYKDKNRYQNETEDKNMYYLVLEFMPNGSLDDYIKNCRQLKKVVEQNFILKIFKQLLLGIKYLHENKIMHRDIKLDNILLDENNNIKISDFGISAIHRDDFEEGENIVLLSNFTRVGRIDFVAPEILSGTQFDYKIDIFSI